MATIQLLGQMQSHNGDILGIGGFVEGVYDGVVDLALSAAEFGKKIIKKFGEAALRIIKAPLDLTVLAVG